MSSAAIAARTFSATSSAPAWSVSGSSRRNSSPPRRPAKSLARTVPESACADGGEDVVAGAVAEAVVDLLEVVEVEQHGAERGQRAAGVGDHALEGVVAGAGVGQAGERVGGRARLGDRQQRRLASTGPAWATDSSTRVRWSVGERLLALHEHRADHLAADERRHAGDLLGGAAADRAGEERIARGALLVGARQPHRQAVVRAGAFEPGGRAASPRAPPWRPRADCRSCCG